MKKPVLEINTKKLSYNAQVEVETLAKYNVEVMGVNKVFNGCFETAEAIVSGGIRTVAEARLYNLIKLKDLECEKCLLRSPCLSEIEDVIKHADISLNSDIGVIDALSAEAVKQGKIHKILLMIDMGDIREGVWFEDTKVLEATFKRILDLPKLELYGIGTNFNCFGTVLPTVKNGNAFLEIGERLEKQFNVKIPYYSAGNCTSYHLIDKGIWPRKLNHLRIGGLHQFGIEYVDVKYLDEYCHSKMPVSRVCSDLYLIKAEIIEINSKPTVPVGELGVDAFLKTKEFVNHGVRKRALLALGLQDVPIENCWPVDPQIQILGQNSDHTVIDIHDCSVKYKVGDQVSFEIDYTALLMACQAEGIENRFIEEI